MNNNVTEVLVPSSAPVEAATVTETMAGASSGAMEKPQETPLKDESVLAETVETPKEDPKFAARFAALSRKEKELIERERAFKENQVKMAAYEKAVAEANKNPLQYLQAAGLTLEQALQKIIEADQPPTETTRLQSIEEKIAAYEKQMEEERQKLAEQRKTYELNKIKEQIGQFIQTNSETYELIKEYNAIDDVWSVIERTFVESGGKVHLTLEQASQAVEDQLLKEATEEAERIARIKKLNKSQQLSSAEDSLKVSKEEKVRQPSITLTNQSASISSEPRTFKSREESLAEAAKLLKWK